MNETDPFWVWVALGLTALVLLVVLVLLVIVLVKVKKLRGEHAQVLNGARLVLAETKELHFSVLEGLGDVPKALVRELIDLEDRMNRRDGRGRYARQPVMPAHAMPGEEADPLAELARLIGQTDLQGGGYPHHNPGEDGDDWPPRQ